MTTQPASTPHYIDYLNQMGNKLTDKEVLKELVSYAKEYEHKLYDSNVIQLLMPNINENVIIAEFESKNNLINGNVIYEHSYGLSNFHDIISAKESLIFKFQNTIVSIDEVIAINKYYKVNSLVKIRQIINSPMLENPKSVIIENVFKITDLYTDCIYLENITGIFSEITKNYAALNAKLENQ